MMFIIAKENPCEAVDYLVTHTNKQFYFKQLIELGQLICSAGFSNVYKKVYRGKEIQEWIRQNPMWTLRYYSALFSKCSFVINFKENTKERIMNIMSDLHDSIEFSHVPLYMNDIKVIPTEKPKTAIFRYEQGYKSKYPTNSELPIEIATNEYILYIEQHKFKGGHK